MIPLLLVQAEYIEKEGSRWEVSVGEMNIRTLGKNSKKSETREGKGKWPEMAFRELGWGVVREAMRDACPRGKNQQRHML